MHVLLLPLGTAGDVHPYVGLGRRLDARGHRVTIITSGYFESLVRQAGLDFVALGTADEYRAIIGDADLWNPKTAFRTFAEQVAPQLLRPTYEAVVDRYVPGKTVVAACWNAFGARVAQEKFGIPLATLHTAPAAFRSVYRSPVLSELPMMRWMPRRSKRVTYWFIDRMLFDKMLAPPINAFRAQVELPPIRRFVAHWWDSPQRIIGLFPEWFGPPQPDWPPQARLTGFPLYDGGAVAPLPTEVADFLDAGDPPIVFTPGSPIQNASWFFEASIEACRRLGRRGLLLTRFSEQVPTPLPEGIRHFDYVPFSRILPQAAALVHHGGLGSAAQALAAGIPQLVMPLCNDQPDNGTRLIRLGVARTLKPKAYRGPEVTRQLEWLLDTRNVAARCRVLADRIRDADPLDETCSLIEELGGQLGGAASGGDWIPACAGMTGHAPRRGRRLVPCHSQPS